MIKINIYNPLFSWASAAFCCTGHFICYYFILLLSSCSLPHFHKETKALPSTSIEEAIEASHSESIVYSQPLPQDWWKLFNDPQLTAIIETALSQNTSLQIATATILSAAYKLDQMKAALYPSLSWGGDISRQKFSETAIIPFEAFQATQESAAAAPGIGPQGQLQPATGGLAGIPVYFTQYESAFKLQYNFDLWNKNRNSVKAALGEIQASLADEAFKRLLLTISIAQAYFELQINYERKKILETTLSHREELVKLTEERVANHIDNAINIHKAQGDYTLAKQALLQIEGYIDIVKHQLQAYMSEDFSEKIVSQNIVAKALPKIPLPDNLPFHLLAMRPDIMVQKWLIEAASDKVKIAQAAFYPDINLVAFWGLQTIHSKDFFLYDSTFFNVMPAVTLPIFDGGLIRANLNSKKNEYLLAILKYNNLVINAVKEVLDALSLVKNSDEQLTVFNKNRLYQEEVASLTAQKVENNLGSNIDRFNSELYALNAEELEVIALGQKIQALLSLIQAVGGGYNQNCLHEPDTIIQGVINNE